VCGVFALLATLLSLYLILKHVKYFTVPNHQVLIIRIIVMVPIYSLCSWLSLPLYHYAIYIDLIRDLYVSVVWSAKGSA
jgi:hypothetical protein